MQRLAQDQRQELVRATSLANIQHEMVQAEQSVEMAELQAKADIKQATGEAESTRLKALGEAESIRQKGKAQSEVYRASVEALGAEGYTALQLMQIVGEQQVRIVPDVLSGAGNGNGMVEGLLGMLLHNQVTPHSNGQ